MKKDFLSITDITAGELQHILILARELKEEFKQTGTNTTYLQDKSMAMIFEKPSLRTRLSFEIAMTQLGGHAIYLGPSDIGLGVRESIADVSKVTSSMADIIMARTFAHKTIEELATFSTVPVINALSDKEHPCQILADLLTIWEYKHALQGIKLVFIGDGNNNVTHSLCLAASMLGMRFVCSSPKKFTMHPTIIEKAKRIASSTGATISEITDPSFAADQADVIYTDTWISMGQEKEKVERLSLFKPYQVTKALLEKAKKDAIFMHDLPAYRGNEVTTEVIDGKQSVIFAQAENRLHAQKALIYFLSTYVDKQKTICYDLDTSKQKFYSSLQKTHEQCCLHLTKK